MQGQKNDNNSLKKELNGTKSHALRTQESLGEQKEFLASEINLNEKLQSRTHNERLDRLVSKEVEITIKKLISEKEHATNQAKIVKDKNQKLKSIQSSHKKETSHLRTKITQKDNIIRNLQKNIQEINQSNHHVMKRKERTIDRVSNRIKMVKKDADVSKRFFKKAIVINDKKLHKVIKKKEKLCAQKKKLTSANVRLKQSIENRNEKNSHDDR